MPVIDIQHTVTDDDFTRYTQLAQALGYADLTAFLQREINKALFALTLPPAQQLGLRPEAEAPAPLT
jgi:hypothetical protein